MASSVLTSRILLKADSVAFRSPRLPRRLPNPFVVRRKGAACLSGSSSSSSSSSATAAVSPSISVPVPIESASDSTTLRLRRLATEFRSFPESIDRVKRLLSYAADLPPLPDSERVPSNRVMGCTAQVWLSVRMDNLGLMRFGADSDSRSLAGSVPVSSGSSMAHDRRRCSLFVRMTLRGSTLWDWAARLGRG
ncbi:hypothetical protein HPP92_006249 [Vanilla planifolia]|uniref:Fe-S metabolism associated domain-containing protein n=1 Tax=Vanilla planifolia TaxID=51239 RepID=A0A835VDY0_VANPL|nr:hypothetical protein HPP92_006249 [Vanilla planifolia]